MQYCEWTHVIGEIITCRIVGSFMKGSDGHEHKAQREKKHGRDSSQCWRQWGWCCTCDTTHSHSPIQSLHSLTCTHSYVLLTQKYSVYTRFSLQLLFTICFLLSLSLLQHCSLPHCYTYITNILENVYCTRVQGEHLHEHFLLSYWKTI